MHDDQVTITCLGKAATRSVSALETLTVKRGLLWATITIEPKPGHSITLGGIGNRAARRLKTAAADAIASLRHRERVAELIGQFGLRMSEVQDWVREVRQDCQRQLQRRGWLTREFKSRVATAKPLGLDQLLAVPEVASHLKTQTPEIQEAVSFWRRPFTDTADGLNKQHLAAELISSRPFFDMVEKTPLTQEQATAVACFDSRVLLVASAGSGKTSTMVAKAGYALKQGYFAADRILLLAFNNDAAAELRQRIQQRLKPLGLPAEQVTAKTFHAFGLDVVGAATGKKPSLAPWVESGRDLEALLEMVDELRNTNPVFRVSWDLFRLVFGEDLPRFGAEQDNPDSWDKAAGRDGFWTLQGEVVKSRGELVIANWLFYNGVEYQYEAPYKVDTADAQHRQYRPDFYLPGPDLYLEHWALDARGEPPAEFTGYKESMVWKRALHQAHQTKLLETTMAELWSGKAFAYLEQELHKLNVELDPNPDREVSGRKPIENARLARTFRSFLTHAKSNRLSVDELRGRLRGGVAGEFRFRHEMFLNLFEMLSCRWESRLREEGCIDFDDMLNQAADCIEQGLWRSPYELVMVDEFQDASQARARLISGLVKEPDTHLFAVGDDWQSINRFAGADLSVMTQFDAKFGQASTLRLETTFRCPQALCDISSAFIQKNPQQLRKRVRSPRNAVDAPVRIVRVADERRIRSAIEACLAELATTHAEGDRPVRVFVLGRYRHDQDLLPSNISSSRLEVEFSTAHASKGLEADHVIVPKVSSETLGFPSRVADDPVLQLAMPGGDRFPFAEERRLFYVALTRARHTVTLITVARKESLFISELVRDFGIAVVNADGSESASEVCPQCGVGFLVPRTGPYGPFYGCTDFPRCKHTRKVARSGRQDTGRQGARMRSGMG